ncbi:MAG TPA: SDR family oxidoreductase, partial [Oligoflexia bacterium]|nr:SDR family oxidoreductase [Oligoflexia bacterium]
ATRERFRNATLLKRIAVPEDIASAVAFLLSDKARHITAATLDVNGGQYVGS